MNTQEYMTEIVLPTVLEFKANPRSRRHAYLASIVTFHLKDYLSKAGELNIEKSMRDICEDSFNVVRSVCNGAKHKEADSSHKIPFTSGDDWDRPPAYCGEMVCGLSQLGDVTGGREMGDWDAKRRDIYFSLVAVLKAFCQCYPLILGDTDLRQIVEV